MGRSPRRRGWLVVCWIVAIIGFVAIVGVNVAQVVIMVNDVERLFRETSEDSVEGLTDEDGEDREGGWTGEGTSAGTDLVAGGA